MTKPTKMIIGLTMALVLVVGAAVMLSQVFGRSGGPDRDERLTIVATNFPAYDFARAVAGEMAEVKMLLKPGAEVHDFEPTPQDIIDIANSSLFIYTGGESDEWVEDVLEGIGDSAGGSREADSGQIKTFKMMDAVETIEEESPEEMEEESSSEDSEIEYDEHVWTSLRNAIKIIGAIKDKLVEVVPENRIVFEENANKYIDKLAALDQKYQDLADGAVRKTLVFGDRFPLIYLVKDYGLNYYAAFPGCSEQTEASASTIAFLVDKVKSEKIPVVFKIELSSGKIAETIAEATGAKVLEFNSAHNISAEDYEAGRTYAEIMEDNLKVLAEALR